MNDYPQRSKPLGLPEPITSIVVSGYKSIRNTKIELDRINVLIGPNGAGKSNLIGVFKLLSRIIERKLGAYVAEGGYAARFLHFGPKRTPTLRIMVNAWGGQNSYTCELAPNETGMLFFASESCEYTGEIRGTGTSGPHPVRLGAGHAETRLHEESEKFPGGIANHVLDHLSRLRLYHFHDTSSSAGVKQASQLNDNAILREDARNLPSFLYQLSRKHVPAYRNIVGAIQRVAPFFHDFSLTPSALSPEHIRLQWKDRSSDDYFDASSLSDGTLRFICLATLLLQPTLPSVVLIDEPELGLHPTAVVLLAELLRSASKRSQVIVSTQSTTLVNQMRPEDVLVVENQDGASTFRRLSSEGLTEWLGDYGLGDLWEKNLLGGRP